MVFGVMLHLLLFTQLIGHLFFFFLFMCLVMNLLINACLFVEIPIYTFHSSCLFLFHPSATSYNLILVYAIFLGMVLNIRVIIALYLSPNSLCNSCYVIFWGYKIFSHLASFYSCMFLTMFLCLQTLLLIFFFIYYLI